MHRRHPSRGLAASFLLASALFHITAHAANVTYSVNTTADLPDIDTSDGLCKTSANTCSLRAAVMQADQNTTALVVQILLPAGIYTLTRPPVGTNDAASGNLNLTDPVLTSQPIVIQGVSAAQTIIDGNRLDNVFDIAAHRTVLLDQLTIRNGFPPNNGNGGSIFSLGRLLITRCLFEHNEGDTGGAIFSAGLLSILDSTVRYNAAADGGGGIGVQMNEDSQIRNSAIYGNTALFGGGLAVYGAPYTTLLFVVNTTISQNTARGNGGGIYADGTALFYNATIIGNDADHDNNGDGNGGGFFTTSATGPGQAGELTLFTSIVAGNTIRGSVDNECHGDIRVFGVSLSSDSTIANCPVVLGSPVGHISLNSIGPLQDNGGPTWTHALLPGSEAINGTDAYDCTETDGSALATDQRGSLRPIGAHCDVGAFEYGSFPGDSIFRDGFNGSTRS